MTDKAIITFSHSHHLLKVNDASFALDVLSFEGTETLSTPFSWNIIFTSTDKHISREAMLMKTASLTLLPSPQSLSELLHKAGPLRVVQGVVTGFDALGVSADEARYAITLQPRLALLARTRQNAIWQDMSVPQIAEAILRERHGMRGQDFVFNLSRDYPKREQVMQFDEDDLRFVSRLLAEVGIWFRFTTDTRLNIDVVEFYDGPQGYVTGLTLPAVPPSGLHDSGTESVWAMESRFRVVEKTVSTRDYNYRDASADMNAQADVTGGDDTTYGEAYHWADNYLQAGEIYSPTPATESGAFYARLRHERYLNRQTQLSAKSSCASLMPGVVVRASGSNAAEMFRSGVVITALICRAARNSSMETAFHGIPAEGRYSYRPVPAPRPVMAGTLPARITSTTTNDTYGHIDRDGRYRVSMLFDRAGWESGFESLWVRQARPFAGDTFGLHLPLLAGTEVAIGFEHGNPDRPYIAGVLHDSSRADHVTIRNYKRNVLRTPANNKLRLDDTRGQEHIKLSTEYGGKSQLNLGHLVDSEKQKRGEGFELRTDSWGAIRANKGLFISADGQTAAQGNALEMKQPVSLMKGAVNQLTEWGSVTQTHRSFSPDVETLKSLHKNADELKGSAMLISAPEGIGAVTPEGMLLNSGKGLYLQSLGEVNLVSAQRLSANASKAISLLAQQEGMRLVSAKGPLQVESHADKLSLTSLKDVTVQSTQGHLQLTAKNGITIASGGAYIRLSPAGEIEIHGPGLISLKGQHDFNGPQSQEFPLPELPSSVCKECLKRAQELAQGFVPRK
ncbi:type VI secretion system Vgr family protein [Candidatus Pantoea floridensis]|uniref:Type VI secretion system secreted protein VgrG n=1 Tax=Candidatus Pantoea floridensis TaxID=1938870 RepID=A0A286BYC3_9GAMM|nr:type VI secretion system Vgr family protein [Pantoea floridensis]PIF21652.1 type VI secretion system secreted protein VgrG [Enterobacteriaceae bacterium JKS000233]SOD39163.1 type VI secretion system secreted protein VgrG [Pantoea floridensis]